MTLPPARIDRLLAAARRGGATFDDLAALAALKRERPRFVFASEPDGAWLIGRPGEAVLVSPPRPLRGLALAHQAIISPGRLVPLAGSPGADREAKRGAADWVAAICPQVAAAIRRTQVTARGWVFNAPASGPEIVTCVSPVRTPPVGPIVSE